MIVRDAGDAWQIVLQTDHADLSVQFAHALAEPPPGHRSLRIASERHDDGWAVWEQAPLIDPDTREPVTFLDVQVPVRLAFYRAGIAAITDEDPYAGLLVSMHGAGIYRERYGTHPGQKLTHEDAVRDQVDAFVAEQEASWPARIEALAVDEEERWHNYRLLQLFDRLSLHFCMRDVEAGESGEIDVWRLEPTGSWRIRMEPFPFAKSPSRFTLLRRTLRKRDWTLGEFRQELFGTEPQLVELAIER